MKHRAFRFPLIGISVVAVGLLVATVRQQADARRRDEAIAALRHLGVTVDVTQVDHWFLGTPYLVCRAKLPESDLTNQEFDRVADRLREIGVGEYRIDTGGVEIGDWRKERLFAINDGHWGLVRGSVHLHHD